MAGALAALPAPAAAGTRIPDLARFANPFTGTASRAPDYGTGGGAGNTFPGATAPFGMVQWSPDTIPAIVNPAGGYSWADHLIRGFGLTHISGAGCAAQQDIQFLPTTAAIDSSPANLVSADLMRRFQPSFSHRYEAAQPGYYRVLLSPGSGHPIDVELSAGTRTGAGRFTYPATRRAGLLINAGGSAMADSTAAVAVDPARRLVTGSAESGRFCYQGDGYRVYFAARFDRAFADYGTWEGTMLHRRGASASSRALLPLNYTPVPGGPSSIPGNPSGTAQAGAYLVFDAARRRAVQVRVGLSYVSAAGALANLDAERPSWSFARVRAQARARWNRALSAIYVSGGSSALKRTFYTMLYHALLSPNVFSDADGHYAGMDRRIHAVPAGETRYANFSGWDVYRTQIPLLAMLFPTRASDFVSSLVADAHESGWLPKWSLANMHTDVMVGDPATAAIAGAYAFGAREFDRRAALAAMVKGATSSGRSSNGNYVERPGLATYRLLGYVSFEQNSLLGNVASFIDTNAVWGSASTTLEYEAADFALARYALANGDRATADAMIARARAWTRMLAPSRFLQPRSLTGMFSPGLTPTGGVGFVEGDSAQYTWAVPWDLAGLFAAIGGRGVAEQRLDFFFQHLNDGPSSPYAFLGNEPTLEVPYEYDWLGKPYKTQSVVRRALLTLYDASPAGFPGNDDLGTMSSWYVLSALGLYPEIPGTDVLAIASPLFRRAQVRLAHGTLTIEAPRAAANAPYVHGLLLGGNEHAAPWLTFGSIDHGGRLRFDLARTPDPSWGSADRLAPPSFGP